MNAFKCDNPNALAGI